MTEQVTSPLVSIIIPLYNREDTIAYCLDSIFEQTYTNYEVVIVDDCSTDKGIEVVEAYKKENLQLITLEKNQGAQVARNTGIDVAKGEWVAFLDSDDRWLPQKLEKEIEALAAYNFEPNTVLHCNCFKYYPEEDKKEIWELPVVEGPPETCFKQLLSGPSPMFQGMLTSKKALLEMGLLDVRVPSYQEWDTAIQLSKTCRFVHLKEPLYIYYLHSGVTISGDKTRDIRGYNYILNKYKEDIVASWGKHFFVDKVLWNAGRAAKHVSKSMAIEQIRKHFDLSVWQFLKFYLKLQMNRI